MPSSEAADNALYLQLSRDSSLGKTNLLASVAESSSNSVLKETVVAPLVNAALIEPWNAVASSANSIAKSAGGEDLLSKQAPMKVASADFMSAPWLVENVAGGLGALVPYLIAGKFSSELMRGAGAALETKGATASFLQSEAAGQIIGATAYDGLRDPKQGESRLGYAHGGAAAFGTIYLGGAFKMPFSGSSAVLPELAKRAAVGAAGATAQQLVSSEVSNGTLPGTDELFKAGLSGMVMNIVLPETQKAIGKVVDSAYDRAGFGVSIDHYLERQLNGKSVEEFSPAVAEMQSDFPWARIRTGGGVIDFSSKLNQTDSNYSFDKANAQLKDVLSSEKPSVGLDVMMNVGRLPKLIPEMVPTAGEKGRQDPKWHTEGSVWEHSKMVVDKLADDGHSDNVTLMTTGLLHDVAKPLTQVIWPDKGISNKRHDIIGAPIARDIASRLGASDADAQLTYNLVLDHEKMHHVQKMTPEQLAELMAKPEINDLVELQNADALGRATPATSNRDFMLKQLEASKQK